MKAKGIIFDMDGCLYRFDRGKSDTFEQSAFSREIGRGVRNFFMENFALTAEDAEVMHQDIKTRFAGEVSIGLEKEHGILRGDYFAGTWDMDPQVFMDRDEGLIAALGTIGTRLGLLSAAPRVWVDKVTSHLGVRTLFEPNIFCGDPDIRKPNPKAFLQIVETWGLPPESIVSIGDQEATDILPAKQAGMMTVLVGANTKSSADFVAGDVLRAIELLRNEEII